MTPLTRAERVVGDWRDQTGCPLTEEDAAGLIRAVAQEIAAAQSAERDACVNTVQRYLRVHACHQEGLVGAIRDGAADAPEPAGVELATAAAPGR